jgi:hypothetical protein
VSDSDEVLPSDSIETALGKVGDQIEAVRDLVCTEKRWRRAIVAALVLSIAVGGLGEYNRRESERREDRQQEQQIAEEREAAVQAEREDCENSNNVRVGLRDAFTVLVNTFTPVGSPRRPEAERFLTELAETLPERDCG